ncbi:MAG: hypothetical protein HFJ53_03120 [Clostridia bacterium]|jgi:hypothetical protein|nr:hypothetical protein [Clostridia bacterium]
MNNITDYKKCKEILKKDFSKENNINKLLMDKVSLIDSYNFTFKHEEYATTLESLKRGFIVKVEDVAAKGYVPKDPFMSVNILKAKEEIDNRLDYLYFSNEKEDFFNNVNKYEVDLLHVEEEKQDYEKDEIMTLEELGREISIELANIMFNCEYSCWKIFKQDTLEDYKEQMKEIIENDRDIQDIAKSNNTTYENIIQSIEEAKANLEPINEIKGFFKIKDFYCKFPDKTDKRYKLPDNQKQLNIYIKKEKELIKVNTLFVNKEDSIRDINKYVKEIMCRQIGEILPDGTIEKEYFRQGYIYKNFENFYKREGICYVSELDENNINDAGITFEGICEDVRDYLVVNGVDLNKVPFEDIEIMAEDVFEQVDWQFVCSLIQDDWLEGYLEDFPDEYFVNGKNEVLENE